MNQKEVTGMTRHREEAEQASVPPIEPGEEESPDEEVDVGVLRLMRLQAAIKEKQIVEPEG